VLNAAKFSLNEESFARFLKNCWVKYRTNQCQISRKPTVPVGKIRLHIGYIFKDNKKGLQIFVCNPLIYYGGASGTRTLDPWTYSLLFFALYIFINRIFKYLPLDMGHLRDS
jgi:hypothetical protein